MKNIKTDIKNPLTPVLSNLSKRDICQFSNRYYNKDEYLFYMATGILPHSVVLNGNGTYIAKKIEKALLDADLISKDSVVYSDTSVSDCGERTETTSTYAVEHNMFLGLGTDDYVMLYDPAATNTKKIDAIRECILKQIGKVPKKQKLFLIERTQSGYHKVRFDISNPSGDNLDLYYNDDIADVDRQIRLQMADTNKTGLYIFHGPPGTGKTTFIRHLIANTDRNVLYVPQMLAQSLGEPEFISFMVDNSKCILVIEDSEKFIQSRELGDYSFVANLLNMTDGLLGDCIKMQVICTFNTGLENIDTALLRKGRLLTKYEFNKLSPEKTRKLLKANKLPPDATESMSLAEIFNLKEENEFSKNKRRKIGFNEVVA